MMKEDWKYWSIWENADHLQEIINDSKSRVEVLENLGYNSRSSISRKKLNKSIKKFNLDISSFTNRTDRWDILPDVINECNSISDVLRAVGLQNQGDNHKTAKRYLKEMNLPIPKGSGGSQTPYTYEEIFCKNSRVHRSTVKTWILHGTLIDYSCAICYNKGEWRGEKLSLRLDHINGVNNDNRLKNLRFLCPNCDSQTPTYCGKNFGV